MSQRDIERLRALEKKMSATSASARLELNAAERRAQSIPSPTAEHADAMDKIAMGWLRVHMVEMWSSELRDIIAELGQEVGAEQAPVESVWMFRLAGSDEPWSVFHSDAHRLNTMRAPLWEVREFFSPAHTSEARDADAARLDWLDKRSLWQFRGDYSLTLREALDAAMRQEQGNG